MSFKDWGLGKTFRRADRIIKQNFTDLFQGVSNLEGIVVEGGGNEFTELHVGTAPNTLDVETDGTLTLNAGATVWTDVATSLIGRRLFSNQGTIDYDYNENCLLLSDDGDISNRNDRVVFNLQLPHECKLDSELRLHIHWEQTSSDTKEFTVQYRVQTNGGTKNTTWTTAVSNSDSDSNFTYISGTLNQITRLAAIDLTGAAISAVVQIRFTRSDVGSNDELKATFIDAHFEKDALGSRQEFVK